MYGKELVKCYLCGEEEWVSMVEAKFYDIGCSCGGTLDPTGTCEYDEEYVEWEQKHEDEYGGRY